MSVYNVIYALFSGIVKLLFRIHTHGAENVPAEGAYIICTNHTTFADPIVLSDSSPRRIFYLGKQELFKIPVVSSFLKALGGIPVDRNKGDVAAIKKAISVIGDGCPLCVFAQGTRCPGVDIETTYDKLKPGLGLIASKTGVPVLPVYIRTKNNRVKMLHRTDVYYGAPVMPDEIAAFTGRDKYSEITKCVFSKICDIKNGEASLT
ncbi:MAG: 1-acyl-sn-glycerol-3-phosphate acyltransferase [Firmicutes bacterium]|nr:1-acyl-sn-glycerol-3-phosphate acyltransferase [Bacillota bacterium]MCD8315151.1 1-acyl-sn-glycerol-3-phosphate acyltransferase [Bacillota bacterium]